MKWALVSLYMVFLTALPCSAKQKHCTFRAHTEGNANDTGVFSAKVQSRLTGKRAFIEKTPTISERDVEAFRPYRNADGSFGVLLQLDTHGKLALDTLSIERRGGLLFIFVNGRPITEMHIDRRVSDGKIYLPGGLNAADLELMKKDWPLIGQKKK